MIIPNFFIVGAPKCGTTAWATYLANHKNIYVSEAKEPHYFNTDQPGFRWAHTEKAYLEFFRDGADEQIVVDASVQYLYSKDAARNIAEFNPEARILIMLRRPSAFIKSYHNQLLLNLDENIEDLRTAWDLSGNRADHLIPKENREASLLNYKSVGMFSEQVSRYFDYFSESQIIVTFMDDWVSDPKALYRRLMVFLEVEDDGKSDFPKVHSAKHVSSRKLHRLTQRPPAALKIAAEKVKRIPGMRNFRFSHALRALNKRSGYRSKKYDAGLLQEIDDFFAEDQRRLLKILGLSA